MFLDLEGSTLGGMGGQTHMPDFFYFLNWTDDILSPVTISNSCKIIVEFLDFQNLNFKL
jgi:hypothetical protein